MSSIPRHYDKLPEGGRKYKRLPPTWPYEVRTAERKTDGTFDLPRTLTVLSYDGETIEYLIPKKKECHQQPIDETYQHPGRKWYDENHTV